MQAQRRQKSKKNATFVAVLLPHVWQYHAIIPNTMKTMKHKLLILPLLLLAMTCLFQACNDDETYADKRKRENKQIQGFLKKGAQVKDSDSDEYLLNIPGNIKVISEDTFYAQDSMTNVANNEYVLFKNTGVYMQIVDKGVGQKLADGENCKVIARYTEFDIATDSILTTNRTTSYEMQPDEMTVSNSLGVFTASFTQGLMKTTYKSSAVPNGWMTPFTYINLGRINSADARLAHVRLILPSAQGQSDASNNIYACFYDITFQRGR